MDVVRLCPSIPHEIRVADFVLKNNYFEFNRQIKQQISGVAIPTKLAPPTTVCFWINLKLLFLKPKNYSLWYGLDTLTINFFVWTHGQQKLQSSLHSLNEFHTDIKFTYE